MAAAVTDDIQYGQGHGGSIEVAVKDHVAVVTLRRGENRFNHDSLSKIGAALDQVERNPDAHALVFMGEGKFFSTGLDLPWIKHLGDTNRSAELATFLKGFRDLIKRVLTFPMPTVAVLNGHAAAGGALLALAFDVRIMRKDRGFFYINEVRLGLPIQGLLKHLAATKIPNAQAFTEAVVFGKRLTGYDTQHLGITSAICDQHELLNTGHKIARQILADGPFERKNMKSHKENLYAAILEDKPWKNPPALASYGSALTKAKM